jgi:hypothetical protein
VPQCPPRQEATVGDDLVVVHDDGGRDVPALPAGGVSAVREVDVIRGRPLVGVGCAQLAQPDAAPLAPVIDRAQDLDQLRMLASRDEFISSAPAVSFSSCPSCKDACVSSACT